MRRLAAVLLGGLLALAGTAGAHAAPAATDGHCTDGASVTVVVDFQELDEDTIIRCVRGLADGATGHEALVAALGEAPSGTIKDGPGFVCRIAGHPAADTDLVLGGSTYREDCVVTPPREAFWSYWHASAGGDWTYASFGIANREVQPGGYEGWSFSLDTTGSGPVPPRSLPTASDGDTVEPGGDGRTGSGSEPASDGEVPMGTVAGVGFVGAAALAGGVVWWRRREG
ncbi:MAG: hypothetical protein GX596_10955 [Propionibacterium sp.]|nr:hypothetical protein [Propionibacterium sp.]